MSSNSVPPPRNLMIAIKFILYPDLLNNSVYLILNNDIEDLPSVRTLSREILERTDTLLLCPGWNAPG